MTTMPGGPWNPQLAPIDLKSLPLSAEEGYLVSRIDGRTSVEELALLTGLPRDKVTSIVERLVETGAVLRSADEVAAAVVTTPAGHVPEPEFEFLEEQTEEGEAPPEEPSGSHLKLYREAFHSLGAEERAQLASTEQGARLSALCFDPLPAVIQAILKNPNGGPPQARLIAAHHHTGAGLEFLVGRADLMRDAHVQRMLSRNPQLNEGQLRRLVQSKRLLEIWKLTVSR